MKIKHGGQFSTITITGLNAEDILLIRDALASSIGVGPGGDDQKHLDFMADGNTLLHAVAMHEAFSVAARQAVIDDREPPEMANLSAAEYYQELALTDLLNSGRVADQAEAKEFQSGLVVIPPES